MSFDLLRSTAQCVEVIDYVIDLFVKMFDCQDESIEFRRRIQKIMNRCRVARSVRFTNVEEFLNLIRHENERDGPDAEVEDEDGDEAESADSEDSEIF